MSMNSCTWIVVKVYGKVKHNKFSEILAISGHRGHISSYTHNPVLCARSYSHV
jgi:hypothetical protein